MTREQWETIEQMIKAAWARNEALCTIYVLRLRELDKQQVGVKSVST